MSSVVDVVDVVLRKETVTVRFHDFPNLPRGRMLSPEFLCMGHPWKVKTDRSKSDDGWLALYLCASEGNAHMECFGFSLKVIAPGNSYYEATGEITGNGRNEGQYRFAKILSIKQCMGNGVLDIQVNLWSPQSDRQVFVPKNPFNTNMLQLLTDEESADIVFQVGGQEWMDDNKRAKTTPTKFHAHKLVLRHCAPQLFKMCRGTFELPINNTRISLFKHMP